MTFVSSKAALVIEEGGLKLCLRTSGKVAHYLLIKLDRSPILRYNNVNEKHGAETKSPLEDGVEK